MTKYGPIKVLQNGKGVTQLVATESHFADPTTGLRPYFIENLTLVLSVERTYNVGQRYFADIKCVTRFPEYGHEFPHNAHCDMPPGVSDGTAVVDILSLSMNFNEFHDTLLEIEFNLGAGAVDLITIPVKLPVAVVR